MIDNPHHQRRWLILCVVAVAQLMIALDLSVVNIALPWAQHDLGFSDDARQWVITAYASAFGSLLLLGGRLGDLFGRKRIFTSGLLGFAAASAVGGTAQSFGGLLAARTAQGAFGALLAPASLALLATTFTDPTERGKAFGIFTAIAAVGGSAGLLLGGVLTEILSWRWCLYVNLLFAVPAAIVASHLLVNETHRDRPPLDLLGTATGSLGLFALVYGFASSEMSSWGNPVTTAMLAASAGLLGLFVLIEARAAHPLLPLRVVCDRTRGGSYLAMGFSNAALFAVLLFLTYYLQRTLGYSPIKTGLAFLPLTAAIMVTATSVNARFLDKIGPRPLLTLGMLFGAGSMVWLAQLSPDSSYTTRILPALLVMGVGLGNVFASGRFAGMQGVDPQDSGVASAMVNTARQVGGSIGTALLSSIFAGAVAARLHGQPSTRQLAAAAAVHGYAIAFWAAAGVFAVGALLVGLLMPRAHLETEPPVETDPVTASERHPVLA